MIHRTPGILERVVQILKALDEAFPGGFILRFDGLKLPLELIEYLLNARHNVLGANGIKWRKVSGMEKRIGRLIRRHL
jgi:hypothetical protein